MIYFGTSTNGKTQVVTETELKGRGIKLACNNKSGIITYKGQVINNLWKYYVTEKALINLKENNKTAWAYGI